MGLVRAEETRQSLPRALKGASKPYPVRLELFDETMKFYFFIKKTNYYIKLYEMSADLPVGFVARSLPTDPRFVAELARDWLEQEGLILRRGIFQFLLPESLGKTMICFLPQLPWAEAVQEALLEAEKRFSLNLWEYDFDCRKIEDSPPCSGLAVLLTAYRKEDLVLLEKFYSLICPSRRFYPWQKSLL